MMKKSNLKTVAVEKRGTDARECMVRRPPVVTSVTLATTGEVRRVFYVRRELLFDERGRVCQTPLELGIGLAQAINSRDAEAVAQICWDALNFVHNGQVPEDWLGDYKKDGPVPVAI